MLPCGCKTFKFHWPNKNLSAVYCCFIFPTMLTVFPRASKFRLSEQVVFNKETTVGYNIPGATKFGVAEGMSMILELTRNCD